MKFKISGVSDNKILLSLKKLTNSFFIDNSFVEVDADYYVNITLCNETVFLCCNEINLKAHVYSKTIEADNPKYTLLALYYQFLNRITNKTLPWGVLSGIRPTKLAHRYLLANYPPSEVIDILQTKYLLELNKAQLLVDIAIRQKKVIKDYEHLYKNISIYINIPFCMSRCTYCSFTSYNLNYRFVSIDEYLEKLLEEIDTVGHFINLNQINITSIYVGGGTPTALNDEQLKRLLDKIERSFTLKDVLEYTLECGRPDTLSKSKLELIKNYSVSRISINPQTFSQSTLDQVNRQHKVEDIYNVFHLARSLNFKNINMDLIMGLPNENITDAVNSVDKTISLAPESITVHTLAYKKGSTLYSNIHEGKNEIEKMFHYSFDQINNHGYNPYYLYRQKNMVGNLENIGYAKEGYESEYNIVMIEELQNIIGLGCGASSKFLNNDLILNPKDLISYVNSYKDYLDKKLKLLKENLVKIEDDSDE
ncbi:MAG: radical protein [Haloplasmataceae bacterium]|jgi:oxygen-independent coproporphyrinogen-3 oxidase|nr:radical protein [Haloplasmataceae bacterium]